MGGQIEGNPETLFLLMLCDRFRIPSISELLERMSGHDIAQWRAYLNHVKPYLDKQANKK